METHAIRDDISRFLVHLTRDYGKEKARNNLVNILNQKTIEARNAHCLVMHKIRNSGFSDVLRHKFDTVCFTETPLTQIKHICTNVKGRKIQLKPYGLIFWKNDLFQRGASPAVYINAKGTSISNYLQDQFTKTFNQVRTFKRLKQSEKIHYSNIVHYYSLINVVKDKHDFLWEREWRHHGNFKFKYRDIVAIIADSPEDFENLCQKKLSDSKYKYIRKLPLINPNWTFEELLEELAISAWNKISK